MAARSPAAASKNSKQDSPAICWRWTQPTPIAPDPRLHHVPQHATPRPSREKQGHGHVPRRVHGRYLALSRWDRESIGVATSTDTRTWTAAATIATPKAPWELIQLGNCGPPIETTDGWLLLTHGVGPIREHAIGATLLDLDDPTTVLGTLNDPILTPIGEERDGYVPNVVYSCGALVHGSTLVLPYGCSDTSIRVAFLDVAELLKKLHESP